MDELLRNSLPFLVLLAVWLFAFIGLRHRRIRDETRRDVQLALLNKFQSAEEIRMFLATDEGRRLLDQLAGPREDPRQEVVGLVTGGCITGSLAGSFALIAAFGGEPKFWIPAAIVGSVCVGLLLAAAVSHRLRRNDERRGKGD